MDINLEEHFFLYMFLDCWCSKFGVGFPGNIKACRKAALKCDELKFEQYKLVVGTRLSDETVQHVHNCQDKLKLLEY